MLVLDIFTGKAVAIGDDVFVTLVKAHRSQCKLAFQAPKRVEITREELFSDAQRAALSGFAPGAREIDRSPSQMRHAYRLLKVLAREGLVEADGPVRDVLADIDAWLTVNDPGWIPDEKFRGQAQGRQRGRSSTAREGQRST